ncbi:hypothetical protein M0P65_06485 [Candidatus Gracilibacteria bacterium]|jgi:hypothetical protein|nr:hypothetical protein [Candidatus Gracilibacteria bacterium]
MINSISNLKPPDKFNSEFKDKIDSKQFQIFTAEVIDIILDKDHPLYNSINDIGIIQFYSYYGPAGFAKPISSYIQKVPLKHESVLIISSATSTTNEVPGMGSYYYSELVNVWNIVNFNPTPYSTAVQPQKESNSSAYSTFSGNTSGQTDPEFGKYFESKANIPSLLPYEGDIIFQGRWGNTMRFGSVSKNKNPWSKSGNNGNPFIAITINGKEDSSRNQRIEDINKDSSSIYICENQKIRITQSSDEEGSYFITKNRPKPQSSYIGNQILLNSDRLFFQSKTDSILFNSKKTIHLSSKESVNIDTKNDIALNSSKSISLNSKKITISGESLFFQGKIKGIPQFEVGATGAFTTFDGQLVKVTNGLIVDIS